MISHPTAYTFLVLNMALWGSTLVVARGSHEIVPPMALAFWRWAFAVVVLMPFVWSKLASTKSYLKSNWAGLSLICGAMVLGSTLSVVAVNFTTALNATLINGSQPAITALIAFIVLRERMPLLRGIGIVVAFVGIVVMISRGDLEMFQSMSINVGDLVMVAAVVAWAVYSVEIHRLVDRPDAYVLLFLIAVSGVVGVLPFYVVESVYVREFVPSWAGAAAIVYISFSASLVAVGLWNLAIQSVGATRAALFINLIPVFGAVLAMIFLRERLYLYHVAGGLFVFFGILMAVRAKVAPVAERPAA